MPSIAIGPTPPLPRPKNVENSNRPLRSTSLINAWPAFCDLAFTASIGFLSGKAPVLSPPLTKAFPDQSTARFAMPLPRQVAKVSVSAGLNAATKPEFRAHGWRGFRTGKSLELELPATYAFPAASTATALPVSSPAPPRQVEYKRDDGLVVNLTRKASYLLASQVDLKASGVVGNPSVNPGIVLPAT